MAETRWHPDLPDALRDHSRLAYLAALMGHREGEPPPPMPNSITPESLPGLVAMLDDPKVRHAVVIHLSPLVARDVHWPGRGVVPGSDT